MKKQSTVCKKWINQAIDRTERYIEESRQAWILAGQSELYQKNCERLRILNTALDIQSVAERRNYLNQHGI